MCSNLLTVEEFMTKCGMSEEIAIQMVKAHKKVTEDLQQQKFNKWKTQTNYDELVSEWQGLQKKAEQAKQKIPLIPAEFQNVTNNIVSVETPDIQSAELLVESGKTTLGNTSKHPPETLTTQNIKDANWVLGSIRNIACKHGDGADGTMMKTWERNIYDKMVKQNGIIEGVDMSYRMKNVKVNTHTSGCGFMCRTSKTMQKHLLTCGYALQPSAPTRPEVIQEPAVVENTLEESDEDEYEQEVVEWTYKGQEYLLDEESQIVYSSDTQEPIGKRIKLSSEWVLKLD